MGIEVTGIRTVVIYVSDVERSRLFYADMLGLAVVFEQAGRVGFDLRGGTRLLLHPSEPDEVRARHGRTELYLRVADVGAAIAFLRERGTPVLQEPTDEGWGERDAAVLDPDGYPVFLTEAPADEWTGDERAPGASANASRAGAPAARVEPASRVIVDSVEGGRVTVEGAPDDGTVGAVVASGEAEVLEVGGAVLVRAAEDAHVRVPHGVHVSVRADNSVTIGGVDGGVDIKTSDGHVTVRDCRGDITINTGDGHVTLEDVMGGIDITTGDGHVRGSGVDGPVHVRTGDGNVKFTGDLGDVIIETGDGDITVDGGSGALEARTGSGEIHAAGTFTDVSAITGDGPITVAWCEGRARAETGDGDVRLAGRLLEDSRVTTGDGTVRVELAPDSPVTVATKGERVRNEFVSDHPGPGRLVIRASEIVVVPAVTAAL